MNDLMKWNPMALRRNMFTELEQMMDEMMRLTGRQFEAPVAWGLAVDVAETAEDYLIKASIPGMDPADVEITLEDNVLTVSGELKEEKEIEESNYRLRERRFGQFRRSINLPARVASEDVEATCADGVLTIRVPKAEEGRPKRIEIKAAAKVIEAETG